MVVAVKHFGLLPTARSFAIAFLLTGSTLWGGSNIWQKIGPEGANLTSFAMDPQDSRTIYVSGFGGSFKSLDGGITWKFMDTGPYPVRLMVDSKNPSTIYGYASSGFVFKTTDGGTNWQRMAQPTRFVMGFAVDPRSANSVYTFACDSNMFYGSADDPFNACRIYKSMDGGATWATTTFAAGELVFDPQQASNLYTWHSIMDGCCSAVFGSTDGGGNWEKLLDSRAGFVDSKSGWRIWAFDIFGLNIDPQKPGTIYAHIGGLLKSDDGGASWRTLDLATLNGSLSSLTIDPRTSVLYASTIDADSLYQGQLGGIFKSMDGGESWSALPNQGLDGRRVDRLFIDLQHPNKLYAVAWGDLFVITLATEDQ